MELYLAGLDNLLLNFNHEPSMPMIQGAVVSQLRKDKRLAANFTRDDGADPGHPDRTLKSLYDSARKVIDRKKREEFTESFINPLKSTPVQQVGKAKPICPYF